MGTRTIAYRISDEGIQSYLAGPESAGGEDVENSVEIDKARAGIHLALAGAASDVGLPLGFLDAAACERIDYAGEAEVWFLRSRTVLHVTQALEGVDLDQSILAMPEDIFSTVDTYPFASDDRPFDAKDYLLEHFSALAAFLRQTANAGLGVMFVEA